MIPVTACLKVDMPSCFSHFQYLHDTKGFFWYLQNRRKLVQPVYYATILKNRLISFSIMTKKMNPSQPLNMLRSPYTDIFFEKLDPYAKYKTYPVGTWLRMQSSEVRHCYLVRTGVIHLYRQPEDVLIGVFEAPSIRGLVPETGSLELSFRVAAVSEIACISYPDLMDIIEKNNLWEIFARHMQVLASSLFVHMAHITSPSAYEAIRFQLMELMSLSPAIRDNISAEKYIRSKTQLSRSGIMRILAQLKAGGYIVLNNGVLKEIINLPAKY